MTLLWHGDEPIGMCVFTSPAISLRHRNRFFGLSGRWSRVKLQSLNRQLVTLSRVVIHPVYRGAGLATWFIQESCRHCAWPWIETLTQMGHINPFFERAGFLRVGVSGSHRDSRAGHSRVGHSSIYGGGAKRHGRKRRLITKETNEKSRFAQPVYYIFDNRGNVAEQKAKGAEKEGGEKEGGEEKGGEEKGDR